MKKVCPNCNKRFVTSKTDMKSKMHRIYGKEFITTCKKCFDSYMAEDAAVSEEAQQFQYQTRIGSEY